MEQQLFFKYYRNFVSYRKSSFQVYLLFSTPNDWETKIWLFHRNHHYHQQLIANNCHHNSRTAVTLVFTTAIQRRPQSRQIQLIRPKVVVVNKRKSVKAEQAKFRWFGNVQTNLRMAKNKTSSGQRWVAQITEANQIETKDFKRVA